MIRGYVDGGRPVVDVFVSLPRIGRFGAVSFLIDTGSDSSVIHPDDALGLGIEFEHEFQGVSPRASAGVGGVALEYVEEAVLSLRREDRRWEEIELDIAIAVPTRSNASLPSLMGRDVLRRYRLTFEEGAGLVLLQRPAELGNGR